VTELMTRPHPSPPSAQYGWRLADTAMLRLNPMRGRRFGGADLRLALSTLYLAEQQRAALRERACDDLFALAGTVAGRDRHRLLQLKRAIFNGRDPEPGRWDIELPAAVTGWLAAAERAALARSAVRTGHQSFLAAERETFAELLGSEPFLLSLALNSPQVLDAAQRYRRSPGRPSARDRKSERGLIQHVARALVRVSPLARLTAVGFATWEASGPALDQAGFDRPATRSVVSPDRALFSSLLNGIVVPPGAGPAPLSVQRNPTLRETDGKLRFHQVAPGHRRVLEVELNPQLRLVQRLTATGPIGTERLVLELADRLAVPVADAGRLVSAVLSAQILVAAPVLDEQAADPVTPARELLAQRHPAAAQLLGNLRAALDLVSHGSVGERIAALARVRATEAALNDLTACPAKVHVNEDYLLPPGTVSARGYEPALADLARVTQFHTLFDRHNEIRAMLSRAFVDRFGPGARVSLVEHAEELVELVRRRELRLDAHTAREWGPADGSLGELLRQRTRAVSAVTGRIRDAAGRAELDLNPDWLAGLADRLPERFQPHAASYGLLVQPVAGRLVLNACYTGHGQISTRFLGAQADLGGDAAHRLTARIRQLYGEPGARLVEDHGLHRSNINHRVRLLEDTIAGDEWLGVQLVHDPATDALAVLDRAGTPLRVMGLGMKWIELQPAALTLAVWLHDTGRVAFDPVGRVHQGRTGWTAQTDPTVSYPRLTAGQVVLQRRRWYPGSDLPSGAEPMDEAEYLLAVTAWRAANQICEEIMLKTPLGMPSTQEVGEDGMTGQLGRYLNARRREKPQYVDLGSALMVRVLPKLLERRGTGYLEEALPGVRAGAHAVEWAVEYDRGGVPCG
jgi:hypothetical protein